MARTPPCGRRPCQKSAIGVPRSSRKRAHRIAPCARHQHRIILTFQRQEAAAQKHARAQAQRLKALPTLRRAVALRGAAVIIEGVLRVVIGHGLVAALRHAVPLLDERGSSSMGVPSPPSASRAVSRARSNGLVRHRAMAGGRPPPARLLAALVVERDVHLVPCMRISAFQAVCPWRRK